MKKFVLRIERFFAMLGLIIGGFSVIAMMTIEVLNVFGRKLHTPFPCSLETAESLMITSVFLVIGYVALVEEHTQVTIMTRRLRPSTNRLIDAFGYLFGALIFTFLAYGAWRIAWDMFHIFENRIGVYRFPIWPFRILYALGLSSFVIQCYINTIRFISQAFDPEWKPEEG